MRKLIIFLFLIGLISCDSLLDVNPSDSYSIDTYWTGIENYDAALAGIYNNLRSNFRLIAGETEMLTPNAFDYGVYDANAIAMGRALSTTNEFLLWWQWGYRGIGRANTFLDHIKEDSPLPESRKSQMKGEALFLRALFYSYLVEVFGGVPLITETPNNETHGKLPRSSKQDVVNLIINDLTEAANLLPVNPSNIGRATKGAALSLKARIFLYNQRWAEAAQAAKEVIDLEAYSLFPDYRGMFLPANENNEEIIFDVQYLRPFSVHVGDHYIYTWGRPVPLKDLVDAYLMLDGKTITESILYDPKNPYENRDPRLHQTVVIPGYLYNGEIQKEGEIPVHHTGYGQKKLTSYPDNETIFIPLGQSDLNVILIRYAEVLLTYAEALNEVSNAPNNEVYLALNQIRKRPTVNMPEIETGLNKEQMRDVIRLERRIELALENHYYFDIKRWRTAEIVNNGPVFNSKGEAIEIRTFNKDRDYLWAIPHVEIQENPALTQNPGW